MYQLSGAKKFITGSSHLLNAFRCMQSQIWKQKDERKYDGMI